MWTIPFVTDKSKRQLYIDIYNGESDLGTDVTTLIGAPEPIELDMDDDEDIFSPLRPVTGNINVLTTFSTAKQIISMTDPLSRRVRVRYGSGISAVTIWQGYIKSEAYSVAWDGVEQEISIPVASPLEMTRSIRMAATSTYDTSGRTKFYQLLKEINATMHDCWSNVILPHVNLSNVGTFYRANYMSRRDYVDADGNWYDYKQYSDILEDYCKFYGWHCVEKGKNLYFIASDLNATYYRYNLSTYTEDIPTGTAVSVDTITLPTSIGTDSQFGVIPGYKSIEVTHNVNEGDTQIFKIDIPNQLTYSGTVDRKTPNVGESYYCRHFDSQLGTEIKCYQYNDTSNAAADINNIKFANIDSYTYYGASLASECIYNPTDDNNSFAERLILKTRKSVTPTTATLAKISPITPATCMLGAGDYILVKIKDVHYADDAMDTFDNKYTGKINCRIKFGSKYYYNNIGSRSSEWRDTECVCEIQIKDGKIGGRSLDATSWNFNEEGALLPISYNTNGLLTIDIISYTSDNLDRYLSIGTFELKLVHQTFYEYNTQNTNSYRKAIDNGFMDNYGVTGNLTKGKKQQMGLGLLHDLWEPSSETRPEEELGERLSAYYDHSHIKIDTTVNSNDLYTPLNYVQVDGVKYAILCQSLSLRNEELKLTLIDI